MTEIDDEIDAASSAKAKFEQDINNMPMVKSYKMKGMVIEGMDELLRELRYQGNNLNQLTVMARQGRITQVNYEPFTEVYRNAWQTLNSLLSHAV